MSKPTAGYVGREAVILRSLSRIALVNGVAKDDRSPSRPEWCVTGTVTIMFETAANLVDVGGWHYCKKTLCLRENKGPTGKVMPGRMLSFDPLDLQKAKEVVEKRKRDMEEDARRKLEWTAYLSQPIPHLAEQIVNKIHVNDSVPVIRALATLDEDTLKKVLVVLQKEEDEFVEKVSEETKS